MLASIIPFKYVVMLRIDFILKCAFILILLSLVTPNTLKAQSSPKRLLGSFIHDKKVFNYEFTMEDIDKYSLRISTLHDVTVDTEGKGSENKVANPEVEDSTIDTNKDTTEAIIGKKPASHGAVTDTAASVLIDTVDTTKVATDTTTVTMAQKDSTTRVDGLSKDETNKSTNGTISATIVFSEFSKKIFETAFSEQMHLKYKYALFDSKVLEVAAEVFIKIKSRIDFIDDEPITAYIILKKDYMTSLLRANASPYYKGQLSKLFAGHDIHQVEIETEEGAIKNITVKLVMPGTAKSMTQSPRRFLIFKNQFPISISGKFDYEKFSMNNLYCYDCSGIKGLTRYFRLSDILILDIVYQNDKDDYSPANKVLLLSPLNPIAELKKERRSRLLEVAAFTDFIGLDAAEPNGLIQFEAKRRININTTSKLFLVNKEENLLDIIDANSFHINRLSDTKNYIRYQLTDKKDAKNISTAEIPKSRLHSTYSTWFSYVEPKLLFSKLEEKSRFLDSAKGASRIIDATTLYQYQLASFGIAVQIFRLNFPQLKIQWNVLNIGGFWSRTRVALTTDSVGASVPLNSYYWDLGTGFIFRPDNRWGASVGMAYMIPRIWNPEYQLTNRHGLFQNQFDAFLKTNEQGRLFFRYRWTYANHNRNKNFTQIQLGYSLNLFAGDRPTIPQQ